MAQVQPGNVVQVHYTGRLADGRVFGSSVGEEPITFAAGSAQTLRGISQAVLNMQAGEKKTVTLPPEEGFGVRNADLQQRVPLARLPPGVKVGNQLVAQTESGQIPCGCANSGRGPRWWTATTPWPDRRSPLRSSFSPFCRRGGRRGVRDRRGTRAGQRPWPLRPHQERGEEPPGYPQESQPLPS
jgi:hypothetical protein